MPKSAPTWKQTVVGNVTVRPLSRGDCEVSFSGHGAVAERLMLKANKLKAFMIMISGEGLHALDYLNDELKSDIVSMMSDLADEVAALATAAYEIEYGSSTVEAERA
jgi:hypothetical protein